MKLAQQRRRLLDAARETRGGRKSRKQECVVARPARRPAPRRTGPTASRGALRPPPRSHPRGPRPGRARRENVPENATALVAASSTAGRCRVQNAAGIRPVPSLAAVAVLYRGQAPFRRSEPRRRERGGKAAPSAARAASAGVCARGEAMFSAGGRFLGTYFSRLAGSRRPSRSHSLADGAGGRSHHNYVRRRALGSRPADNPWAPRLGRIATYPRRNHRAPNDRCDRSFLARLGTIWLLIRPPRTSCPSPRRCSIAIGGMNRVVRT